MIKRIMCPNCARKGIRSWLASAGNVRGEGAILFWCKKCKKEVKVDIKEIE